MITALRTSRTGTSMPRMLVALLVLSIWLAAPLMPMPLANPVVSTSDGGGTPGRADDLPRRRPA